MSKNDMLQPLDQHIQETVMQHRIIRKSTAWATAGLVSICVALAMLILAIAFFLFMRTFYPNTYIIQTKQHIIAEVSKTIQSDITGIIEESVSSATQQALKESTEKHLQQAIPQVLDEAKKQMQQDTQKQLAETEKKMQQMAEKSASDASKKAVEQAMNNLDEVIEKTSKETLEKAKSQLQEMVQKSTEQQAEKNKDDILNNIVPEVIEKTAEKTLKKAEEKMQKMIDKTEKQQEEKIKETVRQSESKIIKDVVTDFAIFKKNRFDKNGFSQVVTAWHYKSSQDTIPYVQRCYTQKNKRTVDLESVRENKNMIHANPTLYMDLNIDKNFEDKARKLCVFYDN